MDVLTSIGVGLYVFVMYVTVCVILADWVYLNQLTGKVKLSTRGHVSMTTLLWICLLGGWVIMLHFGAYGAIKTVWDKLWPEKENA